MSFIFALVLATGSGAAAQTGQVLPAGQAGQASATAPAVAAPPVAEGTKETDCGSVDKKVEALKADPKTAEQKTAEEKALQNLGLKQDVPKTNTNVITGVSGGMETCK